jgi:hypothetical protein
MFRSLKFAGILLQTGVVGKEIPNCCTKCNLTLSGEVEMFLQVER